MARFLGSGFSAVSGRDWAKQFTISRLAHYSSSVMIKDKSLKQSFVHFCRVLMILWLYQRFVWGDKGNCGELSQILHGCSERQRDTPTPLKQHQNTTFTILERYMG